MIELINDNADNFKSWERVDIIVTNIYSEQLFRTIVKRNLRSVIHNHRYRVPLSFHKVSKVFPKITQFPNQFIYTYNLPFKKLDLIKYENDPPGWWPLDFAIRLLQEYSKPNWTVLDPFMGRGTVGKAAKQLGMDFIGIDLRSERISMADKYINEG